MSNVEAGNRSSFDIRHSSFDINKHAAHSVQPGARRRVTTGLPVDAQLRPAAPGDAYDAADRAQAGWRAGDRRFARYRLSALRLRETGRAPRLQPVCHD